ncbi:unnamed protein product, partial [Gulo gulo]
MISAFFLPPASLPRSLLACAIPSLASLSPSLSIFPWAQRCTKVFPTLLMPPSSCFPRSDHPPSPVCLPSLPPRHGPSLAAGAHTQLLPRMAGSLWPDSLPVPTPSSLTC